MKKILLVGGKFALLVPRAAVLAKTAASVTCCNPSEFAQVVVRDSFALVVLCHSLNRDDLLQIAIEARRRWPGVRLLHVWEEQGRPSPVEQYVDAVASPEPRKLAETVATILATPVGPSAGGTAAPALRKTA